MEPRVADRAQLIEEVRQCRTLWDPAHDDYSNLAARDACWAQVADALRSNCETVKREWKTLRDSLRQALRRTGRARARPGHPPRRWRYERHMAFLFPYLTERLPGGKSRPVEVDPVGEPENDEGAPLPASRRAPPPLEPEALELFFASVCQSTRRLPSRYQRQVQRRVLELVLRAEEEAEADTLPPHTLLFDDHD